MNQKVIDLLNEGRERELGAVLQYMAEHYELEDAMYGKFAHRMKKIGIQEMRHAEAFAERILFLGGVPTNKSGLDPVSGIKRKQSIAEILQTGIDLETGAVALYNRAAQTCAEEGDHVSKQLFEKLAADEEGHLNEFQNMLDFVQKLGSAYLATLTGSGD